jgi:hypothetical protein
VEKWFTARLNGMHCLQILRDIETEENGGNLILPTDRSGITPTSNHVLYREWSCASLLG